MGKEAIIETGVDKLVKLVNEKKKISIEEAAKELSVPKVVVEDWASFLEVKGIIDLNYKFTTPYIVKKGVTKKDIEKKAKEFKEHKEGFSRKVGATLSVIENETAGLKDLKKSFETLASEVEEKVKFVKKDLDKLNEYENLKRKADNQIKDEQRKCNDRIADLNKRVSDKQRFYKVLSEKISGEELKLGEEEDKFQKMKVQEDNMISKIEDIKKSLPIIEEMMKSEEKKVSEEKAKVVSLRKEADNLKKDIQSSTKYMQDVVKKSEESSRVIQEIQIKILEKMKKEAETSTGTETKKVAEKFEEFFSKKVKIDILMDKINSDIEKLQTELVKLVDEATIIEMSMEAGTAKEHIQELENKFRDIIKKKKVFEQEIVKLYDIIKK
jgi:chromosome segregation ATPase